MAIATICVIFMIFHSQCKISPSLACFLNWCFFDLNLEQWLIEVGDGGRRKGAGQAALKCDEVTTTGSAALHSEGHFDSWCSVIVTTKTWNRRAWRLETWRRKWKDWLPGMSWKTVLHSLKMCKNYIFVYFFIRKNSSYILNVNRKLFKIIMTLVSKIIILTKKNYNITLHVKVRVKFSN